LVWWSQRDLNPCFNHAPVFAMVSNRLDDVDRRIHRYDLNTQAKTTSNGRTLSWLETPAQPDRYTERLTTRISSFGLPRRVPDNVRLSGRRPSEKMDHPPFQIRVLTSSFVWPILWGCGYGLQQRPSTQHKRRSRPPPRRGDSATISPGGEAIVDSAWPSWAR